MSQTLTSGQRVRILDATPENPDPKGVVYYDFFRNLTGDVIKAYPDNTVAISIERKSLPQHILKRHEVSEQTSRDRWLNGLSEEDRNKLSEKEKRFQLRYTVLVNTKHVVPEAATNKRSESGSAAATSKQSASPAPPSRAHAEPKRATSADLEAKEREYLESIKRAKG